VKLTDAGDPFWDARALRVRTITLCSHHPDRYWL